LVEQIQSVLKVAQQMRYRGKFNIAAMPLGILQIEYVAAKNILANSSDIFPMNWFLPAG
jgi:hypothetical protein